MKLSMRSITALGQIVTGDKDISSYRSGPQLVRLFNDYGANDTYGQGFPSRWQYAEQRLRGLNDTSELGAIICEVLDPREFLDAKFDIETAVEFLNNWFRYDGYKLVLDKDLPKIRDLEGIAVVVRHPFDGSDDEGHLFIDEQIKKSETKMQDGDYDGAITNARSLVEAVLTSLEQELDDAAPKYDGDLVKLYRRVQKLLNLSPGRPDIEGPFKQVLSGLTSIVTGLSGLSNRMGDRHVRTYRPSKHHAALVVNTACTLANFLFETQQYQEKNNV